MTDESVSESYGRIYCVTNSVNGMKYVGKTVNSIAQRWREHCGSSRCSVLARAIRKYGAEKFTIEQLATAHSIEELDAAEREWIARLGTIAPGGYNLMVGGEGGPWHPMSREKAKRTLATPEHRARRLAIVSDPEWIAKHRADTLKQWQDPKFIAAVAAARTRQWHSAESRAAMMAVRADPEWRAQTSAATKKRWLDPSYRQRISTAMIEPAKARWRDPNERARLSAIVKAQWADPERRKKLIEAQNAGKARAKAARHTEKDLIP